MFNFESENGTASSSNVILLCMQMVFDRPKRINDMSNAKLKH